jgi:hypothetical protein
MNTKKLFNQFCIYLDKEIGCKELWGCDTCPAAWLYHVLTESDKKVYSNVRHQITKSIPKKVAIKILENAIGETIEAVQKRIRDGEL